VRDDERRIDVYFEPEYESPTFDDDGMPMLTYWRHPCHGWGWTLWYLEPAGNGVDDHFIPGDLTSVDEAVAAARHWLDLVNAEPSD
jgi:hypothetical protein